MIGAIADMAGDVLRATSPQAASAAFHDAVVRRGASYLQTRLYRRPRGRLTGQRHYDAGGFVARYAPAIWRQGGAAFDYVCFRNNPLLEPVRRGLTRYRFSDFARHDDRAYGAYWEALGEARIAEGLCATAYGPDHAIASVHVGIPDRDAATPEAAAIQAAAGILVERLMSFGTDAPSDHAPALTQRERDAMAFVAEGKTDWEIAAILGVAEATARFHVDNARRKLGATNRAHAVARFVVEYGL